MTLGFLSQVRWLAVAGLAVASVSHVCGEEVVSATKGGRTVISDVPWTPPGNVPKVIYGTDDRLDVYQEVNATRLRLAKSACGLLDASDLTNNGNGTFSIGLSAYMVSGRPACGGEPFGTQPTAMFCSGFLVAPNIIVTAGHCYDTPDITNTRFVFGFKMTNASTAVSVVNADQVYSGVQILGRQLAGEFDYAVIKLDRNVTAAGVVPLVLRRSGVIALSQPVGVIGHPTGLPTKIAFGAATQVYGNSATGYFTANLDTYGGNSGSPVFNQTNGAVEGILVRGAADFNVGPTCFTSNQLADAAADEDVSRAATFISLIPEVFFEKETYQFSNAVKLIVVDGNHVPANLSVTVSSVLGDSETVVLTDPEGDDVFTGQINLASVPGSQNPGNGTLEAASSDTLTLTYNDTDTGGGSPGTKTTTARIDVAPPVVSNVSFPVVSLDTITISFATDEAATATVTGGLSCGSNVLVAATALGTSHTATFTGRPSCTLHAFKITVSDSLGNTATYDNSGSCYTAQTTNGTISFVDNFDPAPVAGWTHSAAAGSDNWLPRNQALANTPSIVYSFEPVPGSITNARLVSPLLPAGQTLEFYHTYAFESGSEYFDGGVIEYSTDSTNWFDLGSRIVSGNYVGQISASFGNPLAGRMAWSGGSLGTMTKVIVNWAGLPANSRIRFVAGSDNSTGSSGWLVDSLRVVTSLPCVAAADTNWMLSE